MKVKRKTVLPVLFHFLLSIEALAKVLFCHSRGSNRESSFFQKQRRPDTRFHGYDGTGRFAGTFARASIVIVLFLFLVSSNAFATSSANIVYNETDLGGGLWQYDYTFYNTSTNNEYLYSMYLDFDREATVDWLSIPSGWSSTLWGHTPADTYFLDTFSTASGYDIAAGSSLNGFSFTIDYQAGDIPYNAYFDDHQGGIYNTSGYTVTPEPISSVLFLFGGAVFAVRRHLRKRGSKKY